jgi:hypothetical protein
VRDRDWSALHVWTFGKRVFHSGFANIALDQSIDVEQKDHGKFTKISSTSLLLNVGAFGPALRAGSPVTG